MLDEFFSKSSPYVYGITITMCLSFVLHFGFCFFTNKTPRLIEDLVESSNTIIPYFVPLFIIWTFCYIVKIWNKAKKT